MQTATYTIIIAKSFIVDCGLKVISFFMLYITYIYNKKLYRILQILWVRVKSLRYPTACRVRLVRRNVHTACFRHRGDRWHRHHHTPHTIVVFITRGEDYFITTSTPLKDTTIQTLRWRHLGNIPTANTNLHIWAIRKYLLLLRTNLWAAYETFLPICCGVCGGW